MKKRYTLDYQKNYRFFYVCVVAPNSAILSQPLTQVEYRNLPLISYTSIDSKYA
jgi:hypothetical protein